MAYRKTKHPGITVLKRDGKYYARWRDPQTKRRTEVAFSTLGFRTKMEASAWLYEKSDSLKLEVQNARKSPALVGGRALWSPTVFEHYYEHFASRHSQDALNNLRKYFLRRFAAFLEDNGIERSAQLREYHLDAFADSMGDIQKSTRNRYLDAAKAFLRWARKQGYVSISEAELSDRLKRFRLPRRLPKVLSTKNLNKLIETSTELDTERHHSTKHDKHAYYTKVPSNNAAFRYRPIAPFVLLCLLSGMRPGEALALKWDDVDLERGEIRVWGSKTMVERIVPLHDSPALASLLKHLPRTGTHVLGDNRQGGPTRIQGRVWKRLCQHASLPDLKANELRKTCISPVASGSQYSEFLLEARFGHSKDVSVRHYRQAMHRVSGGTVEEWLGVRGILAAAISSTRCDRDHADIASAFHVVRDKSA